MTADLDLVAAAAPAFQDLITRFGYTLAQTGPELVRYDGRGVSVWVRFDRHRSYELGVEIVRGERRFSLGEVLRLAGADDGVATAQVVQQAALSRAVEGMARALVTYGADVLRGDAIAFENLAALSQNEAAAYQHANDLRFAISDARAAWDRGDFAQVVATLTPFEPALSPSELKRLEMARDRA